MGNFYTQNSCTQEGSALDGHFLFMVFVAAKQRRDRGQVHEDLGHGLGAGCPYTQHAPHSPVSPLSPSCCHLDLTEDIINISACILWSVQVLAEGRTTRLGVL